MLVVNPFDGYVQQSVAKLMEAHILLNQELFLELLDRVVLHL